ncbi:MAG: hypothetical protein L0241_32670 [Planctomycetia bacterium]|nr:hypothetical protein [Planctomycetia bacterium]
MKLKYRCLAVGLLLLAVFLALPKSSSARQPPPGGNSITITVDTTEKGKIKANGTFATAPGVTLDKVVVFAFPSGGGVMPAQTKAQKVDNMKKTWGTATLETRVYKGQYSVRADGFFSDKSVIASGYPQQQVDGDLAPQTTLDLLWNPGYPKSEAPKKITCSGFYLKNPNANKTGDVLATIAGIGGPWNQGKITFDTDLKTWVSDPLVEVKTGGLYHVSVAAGDEPAKGEAQKFYSAPFATTQVMP